MTDDRKPRIPFSEEEKAYMRAHAYRKSWTQIAGRLNEDYAAHNNGQRGWRAVKRFFDYDGKPPEPIEIVKIPVLIDYPVIELVNRLGFSRSDISNLLNAHLLNIAYEDGSAILKSLC
jgi:hypothetical protein